MSKPITISLQNLNSLYFKFLNQFVLQHLPTNIYNDVTNLLSLKSAVEVYRFLDKILNSSSSQDQNKNTEKKPESYAEKSNISNQGSTSYVDKDDFMKYQNELLSPTMNNPSKKPPVQLKRTNTYQQQAAQERPKDLQFESYNYGQTKKQDFLSNLSNIDQSSSTPKQAYQQHSLSSNHINVVKHDFDTVSEKHHLGSTSNSSHVRRESKQLGDGNTNATVGGYTYNMEKKSSKDTKDRERLKDQNVKTVEFSKTYSTRQTTEPKLLVPPSLNPMGSTSPQSQFTQPQSASSHRHRLQNLIKETKHIFTQNSKKISRYEKISSDLTVVKQEKAQSQNYMKSYVNQSPVNNNSNGNSNNANNGNGSGFTYMYKRYS